MRKFSKIFENKDELLTNLGTSEDEIKDMCSEILDEGYRLEMITEYIGLNGHIYRGPSQTKEYYPSININLYRNTKVESESHYDDGQTKDQFKDVRNWNGGIYYEDNINILKSIYELCYRFESTFTSDKANVFFSMGSINEICIRITFGLEQSKSPLDFSDIREFIQRGFLYEIQDECYIVVDNFINGDGVNMSTTISSKKDSTPIKKIIDRIIKQIPVSGASNDQEYLLEKIFKPCVSDVYNFCKKQNDNTILRWDIDGEVAKIKIGDRTLIQISALFKMVSSKEIVVAKGIFKDKKERVVFHSMDINVKISPDY